jgi:redox-sensitive bicupin YhaK (pirin superfamily)
MVGAIRNLIEPRPRDLGGFSVRRVLPAPGLRMVGPFIFFDHIGPAVFGPGTGIDVRPHPHIGLATVTYLFEGAIQHRDSLGVVATIEPGAVNWMTAGRGIVHSERTGPELRASGHRIHGIQSWVALPREFEEIEPSFRHHTAASLPEFTVGNATVRVIAGDAYGRASPVEVLTATLYVDVALPPGASLQVPGEHEERACYVAEGRLLIAPCCWEALPPTDRAISGGTSCPVPRSESNRRSATGAKAGSRPCPGRRNSSRCPRTERSRSAYPGPAS